jgi:DNA-binding response OmpR family regulator
MSKELPRVMLVDDEPDILQALQTGLRPKGFKVDAFTDPKAASS